jgi:hypothetical protein
MEDNKASCTSSLFTILAASIEGEKQEEEAKVDPEHRSESSLQGAPEDSKDFQPQPEGKDISDVENPEEDERDQFDLEAKELAVSERPLVTLPLIFRLLNGCLV